MLQRDPGRPAGTGEGVVSTRGEARSCGHRGQLTRSHRHSDGPATLLAFAQVAPAAPQPGPLLAQGMLGLVVPAITRLRGL